MRRTWLGKALSLAVVASIFMSLSAVLGGRPAFAAETPELRRALLATVDIVVPIDGDINDTIEGTGSVLTPDGYILTNYHVMADTEGNGNLYNKGAMAMIAMNDPSDLHALPIFTYLAHLVQFDATLDLAVLKIVAPIDRESNLPTDLNLVTMAIGDSSQVQFNDDIECLGFPGIGGDSVTFIRGVISGFLDEGPKGPGWFKTDAQVNHGNSGGAAINDRGEMIGVPTRISTDPQAGGIIGLIRPINLAEPLIAAATGGISTLVPAPNAMLTPSPLAAPPSVSLTPALSGTAQPAGTAIGGNFLPPSTSVPTATATAPVPQPAPGTSQTPSGGTGPQITGLVFSDSVDSAGNPGQVAARFDPGTKAVYGVFDYAGFHDGATFGFAWQRDGEPSAGKTSAWQAGAQGSYWVNVSNDNGLAEGTYTLTLSLDGQALQSGNMRIGPPLASMQGTGFSPPLFAEGISSNHQPVSPHGVGQPFVQGTTTVYAFVSYSGIPTGTLVSFTWTLGNQVMASRTQGWNSGTGPSGVYYLSLSSATPLPAGHWRLDIQLDGAEATKGEFDVGSANGAPALQPAAASTVQVMGTISDADTGSPIPAAGVWALQPGADLQAFLAHPDASTLYASGTADHKGAFSLSQPLLRGSAYTLMFWAKGYQSVIQRDLSIDRNTPAILETNVQLHQD